MSKNVRLRPPNRERLEYTIRSNDELVDRHPFVQPYFRKGRLLSIRIEADLVDSDAKRLLDLISEIGLSMRGRGGDVELKGADKEWFEAAERVLGPSSARDIAEAVIEERAKR